MALIIVELIVSTIPKSTMLIVFIDKYIYSDLEVGFIESSSPTLMRERNPRVRSSKV